MASRLLAKTEPSSEELSRLFAYTEETFSDGARTYIGGLKWLLPTWYKRPAVRKRVAEYGTSFAGGVFTNKSGQATPVINSTAIGGAFLVHRLVWVWHHGPIAPGARIDHINRNPFDNRISNLRCVTDAQNHKNRSSRKNGPSEFVGVSFRRESIARPWSARVAIDGKCCRVGSFATAEEAAKARDLVAYKHYGEFGNYNFPELLPAANH